VIHTPTYSFTRPSDTSAYQAADLVANSTTAASVVPMQWGTGPLGGMGIIRAAKIAKSTVTATAATFIVHVFLADPGTPTNGDNGALAVASAVNYLGEIAVDMSTGGSPGTAYLFKSSAAVAIHFNTYNAGGQLYGLLEVTGAYAPGSAEVFRVTLDIERV
jgi:hypothetical protein